MSRGRALFRTPEPTSRMISERMESSRYVISISSDDDIELPALDDSLDSSNSFLEDMPATVSTLSLDVERIMNERRRAEAADESIRQMQKVLSETQQTLTLDENKDDLTANQAFSYAEEFKGDALLIPPRSGVRNPPPVDLDSAYASMLEYTARVAMGSACAHFREVLKRFFRRFEESGELSVERVLGLLIACGADENELIPNEVEAGSSTPIKSPSPKRMRASVMSSALPEDVEEPPRVEPLESQLDTFGVVLEVFSSSPTLARIWSLEERSSLAYAFVRCSLDNALFSRFANEIRRCIRLMLSPNMCTMLVRYLKGVSKNPRAFVRVCDELLWVQCAVVGAEEFRMLAVELALSTAVGLTDCSVCEGEWAQVEEIFRSMLVEFDRVLREDVVRVVTVVRLLGVVLEELVRRQDIGLVRRREHAERVYAVEEDVEEMLRRTEKFVRVEFDFDGVYLKQLLKAMQRRLKRVLRKISEEEEKEEEKE